ncbi:MAG: hypothetical protein J1F12_07275 [Muribaculaceae bacterium]|nr:hypothetical protein [Muribaculaceae bacterium]
MKLQNKNTICFLSIGVLLIITSCRNEYFEESAPWEVPVGALSFNGSIMDSKNTVQTRELTQDPLPVTNASFDLNFYIEIDCPKDEKGVAHNEIGTYVVPPGYKGQLEVKGKTAGAQALNWYDATSDHSFWSWTTPWNEPRKQKEEVKPEEGNEETEGEETDPTDPTDPEETDSPEDNGVPSTPLNPAIYEPTTNPLTIKLQNTTLEDYGKPGSWNNGEVFETFIGANSGPYNYKENGRDVPLQFRHLMSKIVIESIVLNRAGGGEQTDIQGDFMFVNMPTEFTFYPHPYEDGAPLSDEKYMKKDGRPIAVTNQRSADPDGILSFAMVNSMEEDTYDTFYICPEVDFSKVEYKIRIKKSDDYNYDDRGEYWGTFQNMPFIREGTDYDDEDGKDGMVLHAGEVAYFNLILQEFGGGGSSIYVRNWTGIQVTTNKHYQNPGIYGTPDGRNLSGTGIDPTTAEGYDPNNRKDNPNYLAKWNNQYQIMGSGSTKDDAEFGLDPDHPDVKNPFYGKDYGIFNLYGDVDMSSYSFYVGGGYIINGNGYTINLVESETSKGAFYLGNMRDVYVRLGDNMIYIDPNGRICIPDESGNYIPTELQMDGTYIRYNLNMTQLLDPDITPKAWTSGKGGSRSWLTDTYVSLPAYSDDYTDVGGGEEED